MGANDRSKASISWGLTVISVTATLFYQLVIVATSVYVTTAVVIVLAALVLSIVRTRKAPRLAALVCILGVCAFIETCGLLLMIVEGVSLGAQNMNFDILFLTCLSMSVVDAAFLAAIFAIQAKKITKATSLMPVFGILGLAITIATSILHGRAT
jgi:hypothetical protein